MKNKICVPYLRYIVFGFLLGILTQHHKNKKKPKVGFLTRMVINQKEKPSPILIKVIKDEAKTTHPLVVVKNIRKKQ